MKENEIRPASMCTQTQTQTQSQTQTQNKTDLSKPNILLTCVLKLKLKGFSKFAQACGHHIW